SAFEERLEEIVPLLGRALDIAATPAARRARLAELRPLARQMLDAGRRPDQLERRPFHWALEITEVVLLDNKGRACLDAIVGHPRFLGGKRSTGPRGTDYREYLVEHIAGGAKGHAELCAYFFLRARQLLSRNGGFGLLATNTIAQGDTREVSLDQLLNDGCVIPRAISSRPWPGEASLEVAHVWARRGDWYGPYVLDERPVARIGSFLAEAGAAQGSPYCLAANAGKSFIGSYVLGLGFTMSPEEAESLIRKDLRNRDVLFPYLNGEDLNSRPDQSASRWVINFRDWPLDRASAPPGYAGSVAANYPDCLRIVEERVRPERQRTNAAGAYVL